MNTYKLMKNKNLRYTQLSTAAQEAAHQFGGFDNLKKLAQATDKESHAIIASVLSNRKNAGRLNEYNPDHKIFDYLNVADEHLRETLKNRNIIHELLQPENGYFKYLDDAQRRNLAVSKIEFQNELNRSVQYVLTLRIEGPSIMGESFNNDNWLKVASEIRKS